jgi:hypothetical protein
MNVQEVLCGPKTAVRSDEMHFFDFFFPDFGDLRVGFGRFFGRFWWGPGGRSGRRTVFQKIDKYKVFSEKK